MIEVVEDADAEEEEAADDSSAPYSKPKFAALTPKEQQAGKRNQLRRIQVPPHRLTPLKNAWLQILQPLVEHMKLQVRMNTRRRCVEIRNSEETSDVGFLQKAADYIKAFMLGFDQ